MLNAVGFSSVVVKTRLSEEREFPPYAHKTAPPVPEELSQPLPGPPGGFEHGQAMTPPTPGSHRLVNPVRSRSRRKMSWTAFRSPGTRLVAELEKATKRPSAEIKGEWLSALPCAPPEGTLPLSVLPVWRSWMKTSFNMFVSPGTRFVARLRNATKRPSAEIEAE